MSGPPHSHAVEQARSLARWLPRLRPFLPLLARRATRRLRPSRGGNDPRLLPAGYSSAVLLGNLDIGVTTELATACAAAGGRLYVDCEARPPDELVRWHRAVLARHLGPRIVLCSGENLQWLQSLESTAVAVAVGRLGRGTALEAFAAGGGVLQPLRADVSVARLPVQR